MHPDPNEAPTSMNVRTRADLDMWDRDCYENRLMNRCANLQIAEGERAWHDRSLQYPYNRGRALRELLLEGDLPPRTWRPQSDGEWPVIEELSAKLGLNIPRVRPPGL
jgi:hypothetical protein